MIEVRNLTKKYGSNVAVNDVSFSVDRGEIVGLLGPNGAGKTSILNMITGYISSTSGSISVSGFDILERPNDVKRNIGYLPELPPLYPDLTVREYLEFVFDLKRCAFDRAAHLDEICQVTKISDVSERLIRNLSKGYKQRVGLAQALIGNPEIMIFDEPTVGLDPKEIAEIRNLIRRLGATHTVILSSHILTEIQAVCERVIIINKGYLVKDSSTEELLNSATPSNRYGIRLAAPEDEVMDVVGSLPGVLKAEYLGSYEKGTVDIIVESDKKTDIRRLLFAECAKRDWYILMITPLGVSLEDIFIQLVSSEPSPELSSTDRTAISGRTEQGEVHAEPDVRTDDTPADNGDGTERGDE